MNLVTVEHLIKSYTERLLFDDTSFFVSEGGKIELTGVSGTGKSTLPKIATNLEDADNGSVVRGRGLYIRYLPQTPEFIERDTVPENIVRENTGETHYSFPDGIQATTRSVLDKLDIAEYDALTSTLPGGQGKRVALANVLLGTADLLILDEPTNHLNSGMADWLEEYLKAFRGAPLVITHDRYFLNSMAERIVELGKGKLYSCQANYEDFLSLKAERTEMAEALRRKRQAILRNEIAWMQRGTGVRSAKQKAHIQRYGELRNQEGPGYNRNVELESVTSRLGKATVEVKGLYKAYGGKMLVKDFAYISLKNDRVGIVDPNGSGKSTLMRMLAGWVEPDSDTTQIGQTMKMGCFSQKNETMDESLKVIDYVKNVAEYVKTKDSSISASQMLERFLFSSGMQYTIVGRLSGGERRRLYLLHILTKAPNVVLLDEPTNDLDIRTLTILEDYLDTSPGIIIVVSYDRYFLGRVMNRILAFEGQGKVSQYESGFTNYQIAWSVKYPRETGEQRGGRGRNSDGSGSGLSMNRNNWKQSAGGEKERKLSFREQREWETIETNIADLERSIGDLEREIGKSATNYTGLNGLMEEKSAREAQLEEKVERWMYLNELVEQVEAQK